MAMDRPSNQEPEKDPENDSYSPKDPGAHTEVGTRYVIVRSKPGQAAKEQDTR
jgi:hypothetical protein